MIASLQHIPHSILSNMPKFPHVAFFLLLLAVPFGLATARDVTTIEVVDSSPCPDQLNQQITDLDQFDADFDQDSLEEIDSEEQQYFDDDEALDDGGYIVMPTDDEEGTDSSSLADDDDEDDSVSEEEGKLGIHVGKVVTSAFFNSIIRRADPSCKGKRFYTRGAFLNATKSYRKFGNLSRTAAKREIAALFAHVTHETGHLCYIEEIQKSTYCDRGSERQWPCAPGKQYFGRGPLQITWNYNYGPCGKANRFNGLKNPDIVAKNRVIAWKTALWFWMKNVRRVLPRGFGATIRAINGGECNGGRPAAVAARVKYYRRYCKRFKCNDGT